LDRREFFRRLIIASALGVAAVSGVAALGEKVLSSQPTSINTLPTPSTSTQNTTSVQQRPTTESSTLSSTILDSTTVSSTKVTGSATQSNGSTTSSKTTSRTTTQSISTSSIPSGYILLAPLSAVSGKTYAYFTHPNFGSSILINYNGTWKAFSAVCTHAGCTVNYSSSITCPCHPGVFSPANGSVVSGPPPSKLAEYDVKVINSILYVGNSVIN